MCIRDSLFQFGNGLERLGCADSATIRARLTSRIATQTKTISAIGLDGRKDRSDLAAAEEDGRAFTRQILKFKITFLVSHGDQTMGFGKKKYSFLPRL